MNEHSYDAASALRRAIRGRFLSHAVTFVNFRSWPWASVTFSGARHELFLRLTGEGTAAAADAFLADLDCAEFHLRGHILADIVATGRTDLADSVEIAIEALTVEDN